MGVVTYCEMPLGSEEGKPHGGGMHVELMAGWAIGRSKGEVHAGGARAWDPLGSACWRVSGFCIAA